MRPIIWDLSLQTAGFAVAFETTSPLTSLWVDYNLTGSSLALPHMSATGVSGADLWAQDPSSGEWKWAGTTMPSSVNVCQMLVQLEPSGTAGGVYPTRWLL